MLVNTRTTYKEFSNLKLAEEKGFYKIYYMCPTCSLNLGRELKDRKGSVTRKSIMKDNTFPAFCPKCGTLIEYL